MSVEASPNVVALNAVVAILVVDGGLDGVGC